MENGLFENDTDQIIQRIHFDVAVTPEAHIQTYWYNIHFVRVANFLCRYFLSICCEHFYFICELILCVSLACALPLCLAGSIRSSLAHVSFLFFGLFAFNLHGDCKLVCFYSIASIINYNWTSRLLKNWFNVRVSFKCTQHLKPIHIPKPTIPFSRFVAAMADARIFLWKSIYSKFDSKHKRTKCRLFVSKLVIFCILHPPQCFENWKAMTRRAFISVRFTSKKKTHTHTVE